MDETTPTGPLPNLNPSPVPLFRAERTRTRPWPLTLLCLGSLLALALTWWLALTGGAARAFGPGYWAYLVATSGALAGALWGLWRLRRWALWAFPAALLLDDGVLAAMGELRPAAVAIEAALVLLVLGHFRAFARDVGGNPGPTAGQTRRR